MKKNTIDIPQEEMDRFHKAMDAERTEQDARLEKLIESEKANIPSNEEIIKMIPSKAVREYLQKIGHQFSERDRYLLWLYLDPKKEDEPFVVPLAIPLVAGPGALSMIMIISAQQPNKLTTLGVVLVASVINSAILMCSAAISNALGKRGLLAIERLTGMILVLTSVNMVMSGIAEFIKL